MTDRAARLLAGLVLLPSAALSAFLLAGRAAAAASGSGSALADAATVAIVALAGAAMATGLAAWALTRVSRARLPWLTTMVLMLALALLGWTLATSNRGPDACGGGECEPGAAAAPLTTALPVTVTGGDSLLGLLQLGSPSDGSGLLPAPLDLRGGPGEAAAVLATVTRWSDLHTREIGYEEPAIAVYRLADPWYLVSTRDSLLGWVVLPDGASVVPLEELLVDRLSYLTPAWDGRLHAEPGAGPAVAPPGLVRDDGEASADVHEARLVAGALWLRVTVHSESPCETGGQPEVIGEGWVPAWTAGTPTAWYYSRGC
jgi:hypothetical protein